MINLNKPYLSGKELDYIKEAVGSAKISGDGLFTKKCHRFFETHYGFKKCLLTTSCTDALEMAAILMDIQPGDEVILPAFTFVSTANAFVLRGAKIVFADSMASNPNMDADKIESLITPKTKAIVPVHYAGVACDMEKIMVIAQKHNLYVVEDAAQAIDSYCIFANGQKRPLGSIGHLAAFSFHETKNIIAGEGGMLVINDEKFQKRAEIIWEKGTNRAAFFRGEIDKYGWVDVGSSFLPSDIIAAFLFAQLEQLENIQQRRRQIWQTYQQGLAPLKNHIQQPHLPKYATNNAHMFYIVCKDEAERTKLVAYCKKQGINLVFHYQSLNKSLFHRSQTENEPIEDLPMSDYYAAGLLRLPFYYELSHRETTLIIKTLLDFYGHQEEKEVAVFDARLRPSRRATLSV
jgi:dTDP-4-amino-4,6-dideoxygalactose transaminase